MADDPRDTPGTRDHFEAIEAEAWERTIEALADTAERYGDFLDQLRAG